jgi:hypothetical protein
MLKLFRLDMLGNFLPSRLRTLSPLLRASRGFESKFFDRANDHRTFISRSDFQRSRREVPRWDSRPAAHHFARLAPMCGLLYCPGFVFRVADSFAAGDAVSRRLFSPRQALFYLFFVRRFRDFRTDRVGEGGLSTSGSVAPLLRRAGCGVYLHLHSSVNRFLLFFGVAVFEPDRGCDREAACTEPRFRRQQLGA